MNYISTRGSITGVTAAQAIRTGIAADGGLFTPETIVKLHGSELESLKGKTYQELAVDILSRYLTDYPKADLKTMVESAYRYPAKFADPLVTPVTELGKGEYILELWHGPTCAFKDVALQLLPYLMTKASELTRDNSGIVILVATSGDTGKAALEGFRDVPGTNIVVFFPDQGVSEIQRLQMVTQEGQNTFVAAVKGNFDDAQNGVKDIFGDTRIIDKLAGRRLAFSSANSINWGRLAPQIVYYFFGYLELCRQGVIALGDPLNITVPTGNFGNILAAYFAMRMGLPVRKLICASNANNVLTDFISSGVYDRNRQFYTTISPSMDILISSNLERLLFYLTDGDFKLVREWMHRLKTTGRYEVDGKARAGIRQIFYGGFAAEAETKATIKKVFEERKITLDTHTAVGVSVYERYRQETGDNLPVLIASTASPFKFNSSVLEAILGESAVAGVNEFALLEKLAGLSGLEIPAGLKNLDTKTIRHKTVCRKEEMGQVVQELLGI
jgi:threonine synthase